jgi:preprotein translocase subunit SecE
MIGIIRKTRDLFRSFIEFVQDTRKELKVVSWPTRRELVSTTIVVIVTVFFFGAFLALVDMLVHGFMTLVLPRISS